MQPGDIFGNDQPDFEGPIDIGVTNVFLRTLTLEPDEIGPFGASTLTWEVEAPPGVRVRINNESVAHAGDRIVQPSRATTYRVFADSGGKSRQLGQIGLSVDLSTCDTYQLNQARAQMAGAISNQLDTIDDIYKRREPTVDYDQGRINFHLNLGKDIDKFPDPTIRVDGSFGVGVVDGAVVPWGEHVTADVSVPKRAWLIPGAFPALFLAIGFAEDTALANGRNVIPGLIQLLNFMFMPPDGMRRHWIRVLDDTIEVTECPFDALRGLVANEVSRLAARRTEVEQEL